MLKKILLLLLVSASVSLAQTVYEPIHSDVYTFLDLMAQKGVIRFDDVIRPVSREYIAERLLQIKNAADGGMETGDRRRVTGNGGMETGNGRLETGRHLTDLEIEELEFYLKDFGMEIAALNKNSTAAVFNNKFENNQPDNNKPDTSFTTLINKDPYDRYRLFSYADTLFKINASPILGYELGKVDGSKYSYKWNGLYMYGYLTDNIGYNFRYQDNSEDGTTIDRTKNFTPVTGISISKTNANNIEYDDINVNLAYSWSWGDLSAGKDYLNWGYGQSGLLVLSDKAPSFPFIRLDIHPTKWLSFNYIHAWLNSGVIDSTQLYTTALPGQLSNVFQNKYLAQHTLTLTPAEGLDISLGESIIYSNQLQIAYLIPVMFFWSADHYLSQNNNNASGNCQFFMGVSSRNQIKNTHLYGTLFIDEITLEGLFNPATQRNQIGFTLGGSVTDLPVDNLTFTLEYTKIYPYVYTHYIPTLTYQSSGYVLGDWMGNNADLVYGAFNYRFLRGLQATLWSQYIRKGGQGPEAGQYEQPQPPFLYGLRTDYTYFGLTAKYEITHELFAALQYQTTSVTTQETNPTFPTGRLNEYFASLYYGIH
jgi:hypothetical protein